MKQKRSIFTIFSLFFIAVSHLSLMSNAWSETTEIEPEAMQVLQNMSDYLAGINKFTVTSHSTIESMLDSGQKIMLDHNNINSVQRPDKLYVTRKGDKVDQKLYYNGKTFTLYNNVTGETKTIQAAATLTEALDSSIKTFNLVAPGADLLYPDSYKRLSNALLSGFIVDTAVIDGVECYHLAFRNTEVDWQIWIAMGDKPLPKRYVVTSRWITGSPQFVLNMKWDTHPDFTEALFNAPVIKQNK